MDFASNTKTYFSVFYILGLSPYRPLGKLRDNCYLSNIFTFLHGLFVTSLALSCIVLLCIGATSVVLLNTMESLVINIGSVCEILRGLFVVLQCLTQKRLIFDVISMIRKLETYFIIHLKHRLPYDSFRKQYFLKVLIVLLGFAPYVSVYIVRCIVYNYLTPIGIQLRILQLLVIQIILYVVFYIDLLSFHLSELNAVIERDMAEVKTAIKRSGSSILTRNKVKCYKNVHFRLWKMSQNINTFFGWILIMVLLHCFVDLVYSAFWLFQEFKTQSPFIKILRMYFAYFR